MLDLATFEGLDTVEPGEGPDLSGADGQHLVALHDAAPGAGGPGGGGGRGTALGGGEGVCYP